MDFVEPIHSVKVQDQLCFSDMHPGASLRAKSPTKSPLHSIRSPSVEKQASPQPLASRSKQTDPKSPLLSSPRSPKNVFQIQLSNKSTVHPLSNPVPSSMLSKDLTIEIDILKASVDELYEIPGIDETTAKFIVTERTGTRRLEDFTNKSSKHMEVFTKDIQFDVGRLGRNKMKLVYNNVNVNRKLCKNLGVKKDSTTSKKDNETLYPDAPKKRLLAILTCNVCHQKFEYFSELRFHGCLQGKSYAIPININTCNISCSKPNCSKKFSKVSEYLNHVDNSHKNRTRKRCPNFHICKKAFNYTFYFFKHKFNCVKKNGKEPDKEPPEPEAAQHETTTEKALRILGESNDCSINQTGKKDEVKDKKKKKKKKTMPSLSFAVPVTDVDVQSDKDSSDPHQIVPDLKVAHNAAVEEIEENEQGDELVINEEPDEQMDAATGNVSPIGDTQEQSGVDVSDVCPDSGENNMGNVQDSTEKCGLSDGEIESSDDVPHDGDLEDISDIEESNSGQVAAAVSKPDDPTTNGLDSNDKRVLSDGEVDASDDKPSESEPVSHKITLDPISDTEDISDDDDEDDSERAKTLMEANPFPSNYLESVSSSDESNCAQVLSEVSSKDESDNGKFKRAKNTSRGQELDTNIKSLAVDQSPENSLTFHDNIRNSDPSGMSDLFLTKGSDIEKSVADNQPPKLQAQQVTEISFANAETSLVRPPVDKCIDVVTEPQSNSNSLIIPNDTTVQDFPTEPTNDHANQFSSPLRETNRVTPAKKQTPVFPLRKVTPLKIKIGKRAGAQLSEAATEDDSIEKKTSRKKKKRRKISITDYKRVLGKVALCSICGSKSENLSFCSRCKRKLPDDVKLLDDPYPSFDKTSTSRRQSKLGEFFSSKNQDVVNENQTDDDYQKPSCIVDIEEKMFSKSVVCLTRIKNNDFFSEEENFDSSPDESEAGLSTLHEALVIESSNPQLQRFRVNKKLPPFRPPQKKSTLGIKMFACNVCSELFQSYDLRKEHYRQCNVNRQSKTDKKQFKCYVCKRKFDTYQERREHYKLHMETSPQTDEQNSVPQQFKKMVTDNKVLIFTDNHSDEPVKKAKQ